MKRFLLSAIALLSLISLKAQNDSTTISQIFRYTLTEGECYEWLGELTQDIGGRLSGSPEAAEAVEWGKQKLEAIGCDKVWLQPVMVPHWVRGEQESAHYMLPGKEQHPIALCALGGSVGTPDGGLQAEVIEVQGIEELKQLDPADVKGKIVFYNRPMLATLITTFRAYGGAVDQRTQGAAAAAEMGAVGVLVRSMTLSHDDIPHTGVMRYKEGVAQIPAAAISTVAADNLSNFLADNPGTIVSMEMHCKNLPDAESFNVIGEITGSEQPDEYITIGGHLDSWDLGEGAHDDGAGIVHVLQAAKTFIELGIHPIHSIRIVLYMNEENGIAGGTEYAKQAMAAGETHLAAIESDAGGFTPRGFGLDGSKESLTTLQSWRPLLEPYGLYLFQKGYGGADINKLKEAGFDIPLLGFIPDSQRYFDYHHTSIDTYDKVNKRELELGAASIASVLYLIDKYGL